MGNLNVVGLGPGNKDNMTFRAYDALIRSDYLVGYTNYIKLIPKEITGKEIISTGMGDEVLRCEQALEKANEGYEVSLVCSGDSVIYGMASLCYELINKYKNVTINVVPAVTAAVSGSALIGAALGNDFTVISLSNYLTKKEDTYKRLKACAEADFVMALYNPKSNKRPDCLKDACEFLLKYIEEERICAVAKNIGRENETYEIMTLIELKDFDADMYSTVFIGSSMTTIIDDKFVTKRGYSI